MASIEHIYKHRYGQMRCPDPFEDPKASTKSFAEDPLAKLKRRAFGNEFGTSVTRSDLDKYLDDDVEFVEETSNALQWWKV